MITASLASVLSGIPYSLTIHGPTEFDMPGSLALDEKIGRAKFTVAIDRCLEDLSTVHKREMVTLMTHKFQMFENVPLLAA